MCTLIQQAYTDTKCMYKTLHFYSTLWGRILLLCMYTYCTMYVHVSYVHTIMYNTYVHNYPDAWVRRRLKRSKGATEADRKYTYNVFENRYGEESLGVFVLVHQWDSWLEVKRVMKSGGYQRQSCIQMCWTATNYIVRCPLIEPQTLRPHSLLFFLSTIQTATVLFWQTPLARLGAYITLFEFEIQFSHFFTSPCPTFTCSIHTALSRWNFLYNRRLYNTSVLTGVPHYIQCSSHLCDRDCGWLIKEREDRNVWRERDFRARKKWQYHRMRLEGWGICPFRYHTPYSIPV